MAKVVLGIVPAGAVGTSEFILPGSLLYTSGFVSSRDRLWSESV